MRIYFPMTCNILTKGHIKCLEKLSKKGKIVVGLLTSKALEGYKKERMPFKDRKYILQSLKIRSTVVPQNSLNPEKNIKKYKCSAIASGDGWEPEELQVIKDLGLTIINIKSGEKLHSSNI